MPIYILTLCKIVPGEPTGIISDLMEDVFNSLPEAMTAFENLKLNPVYFMKELWEKTKDGRRVLIKEERYARETS